MLTQDLLRELFTYDPETGSFVRKVPSPSSHPTGPTTDYPRIFVAGRSHRIHRLVWLYMYGEIPKGHVIDHIDGDRNNNRLSNLRCCLQAENLRNKARPVSAKSPFKGVSELPSGRFSASITLNRATRHIGVFDSPEEAARAYDKEAEFVHGEFARTNSALGLL